MYALDTQLLLCVFGSVCASVVRRRVCVIYMLKFRQIRVCNSYPVLSQPPKYTLVLHQPYVHYHDWQGGSNGNFELLRFIDAT